VYSVGSAAPILIAALSAGLTANWLGGAPYSLDVAQVSTILPVQAGVLIALALTVGAVGIGLVRLVTAAERALQRTRLPYWLSPAVGGLCVGGMALITPQVLAAGHGAMVLDLSLDMSAAMLLGIVGLKIAACVISLASGFRGGLFFASLFVGCLIGKLLAVVLQHPLLGLAIDPTVTALAGMACLGVAVVGGPLTMSFLVLELTRNIEVTAWIVVACLVTSTFVRAVFGYSFSTWRLHLRGESIRGADDVGWLRNLTVGRLMRTDLQTVPAGATVAECRKAFPLGSVAALCVVDEEGAYRGTVTPTDLFSSDWTAAEETPIVALARHRETVLFRPMNVRAALRSFEQAEAEVLAVLDDPTRRTPIGFLSESSARRRYGEEMDKAAAHLVGQTWPGV
jgi:CIC family chloride channel protein